MYLNGLLSYFGTVINNGTRDKIHRILISFYNNNDIIIGKKTLWSTSDLNIICEFVSRNNSSNISQSEANSIDIIDAMKMLDK